MIYSPSELKQLVRTGLRRIFGCGVSRVAPEPDSTSGSASRGSEQVACNEPPSHHQKAHDHAAIPLLAALDDRLVAALENCAIKLLVADFVRDNTTMLPRILRRQQLEELERSTGARIFFSPSEAVEILRTNARLVAALTYGWCSPDDPDVSGAYLEAVRRYLRSPIGAHVVAIFWDFPSLPQKPRSNVENSYFSEALGVMGDVYSSALGTTVVRHCTVPPRPPELDGEVVVLVKKGGPLDTAEAAPKLQAALSTHGELVANGTRYEQEKERWRVRFATHAAAEAAVATFRAAAESAKIAGAEAIFIYYNGRPYDERGWTCFESGVSTMALKRVQYFARLKEALVPLPPKLVEIDAEGPREAVEAKVEGVGPQIERVRASLQAAHFNSGSDKDTVGRLYSDYVAKIGNAMAASGGGGLSSVYEGERNAAGQREGRGTARYPTGNVYEGNWKAGKREGRGTERFANGNIYVGDFKADKQEGRGTNKYASGAVFDGEYKAGKKDGRGTYTFADGRRAAVGRYVAGADVGEGCRWSADRETAWRLQNGQPVEEISLAEAAKIAEAVGLPVPPPPLSTA